MEALKHLLFIDIETACGFADHAELSGNMQHEWLRKAKTKWNAEEPDVPQMFFDKAAVFAEFGKIVCISIGCLRPRAEGDRLLLRSFAQDDEKALLEDFCSALSSFSDRLSKEGGKPLTFVGHNIKEFDLPYISRRMIVHGMCLPECLRLHGKKPWEVPHMDTMELWSFGDRKAFTRLALLAEVLGIPTPKDDISGEDVSHVYWHERNLPRIVTYCQKDVETTARIFLRLMCYDEPEFVAEVLPAHDAAQVQ